MTTTSSTPFLLPSSYHRRLLVFPVCVIIIRWRLLCHHRSVICHWTSSGSRPIQEFHPSLQLIWTQTTSRTDVLEVSPVCSFPIPLTFWLSKPRFQWFWLYRCRSTRFPTVERHLRTKLTLTDLCSWFTIIHGHPKVRSVVEVIRESVSDTPTISFVTLSVCCHSGYFEFRFCLFPLLLKSLVMM